MVKLSEILRKSTRESSEIGNMIADAAEQKAADSKSFETEKIYRHVIESFDLLMEKIKDNKVIEGKEIESLAGMILGSLMIDTDLLQNLTSITTSYGDQNNFLPVHSVNVSIIATNLGFAFDFDKATQLDLCMSALLHDIGMLIIPRDIVQKPDKLTRKEYDLIKMHSAYGVKFLQNIKDLPEMTEQIVLQHHEKINGKGYPEGKKGEQVSKFAQIVGVVEIYEAISHPRPYRTKRIIPSEAVRIIIQEESASFEKDVLRAFMSYITIYPTGSYVKLNSNEIGVVQSINHKFPLRPVIEVILDTKGNPLNVAKTIDLSKSPILYIEKAIDDDLLT
ncbi:MAG: HD domain-containing protein [Candidatus Aminicenantes bacterium]|nr:HD domain-containing protein [Candidatus Aminicenantes bacterium]